MEDPVIGLYGWWKPKQSTFRGYNKSKLRLNKPLENNSLRKDHFLSKISFFKKS